MFDMLQCTLTGGVPITQQGETPHLSWHWLAEGMLLFTPKKEAKMALLISVGIHGNETAPIELINQLCSDLLSGKTSLEVHLLVIFANIAAMRVGKRYLDDDMNRMFCQAYTSLPTNNVETRRAEQIEQITQQFFQTFSPNIARFHLDLHTAIRSSLLPTFAILPFQKKIYDAKLIEALSSAEIDAVVYHSEAGQTFSHYTSSVFGAASVTLELGKAKAFGENDLSQFQAVGQMIHALIKAETFPLRTIKTSPMRHFQVIYSLMKSDDDFQLMLAVDAPNFTVFQQGEIVAKQSSGTYVVQHAQEWILFPNPSVKKGLRAGLMLVEKQQGAEIPDY